MKKVKTISKHSGYSPGRAEEELALLKTDIIAKLPCTLDTTVVMFVLYLIVSSNNNKKMENPTYLLWCKCSCCQNVGLHKL